MSFERVFASASILFSLFAYSIRSRSVVCSMISARPHWNRDDLLCEKNIAYITSNLFPIGAGRTHRLAPYEARKRFFFFSLAMLIHSLLRNNFRLSFSIFISISLSECSAHKRQTDSNSLFKKKYQYTSDHRETWWDDECEGKEKRKARHKIWPFSHSPSFQNSRSKNEYIFYYKLRSHS